VVFTIDRAQLTCCILVLAYSISGPREKWGPWDAADRIAK